MSETVEKKDRSAAATAVVLRLFFLEANAGRIHSMGRDPDREPPFFFTKRTDAVVDSGAIVPCPSATSNFQYEIELVVAIGREGFDVSREAALDLLFGYYVGINLARRDLQLEARDRGRPWDWGKAFDQLAPVAPLHCINGGWHRARAASGSPSPVLKQDADLVELVWPVADIVSIHGAQTRRRHHNRKAGRRRRNCRRR